MSKLHNPLTLPCGISIPNRIAKAAMTEQLAGKDNRVNDRHINLYHQWAKGLPSLLITGNVMVDPTCLEAAGNIVICGPQPEKHSIKLTEWAKTVQLHGRKIFMQISHAGRQTPKTVNKRPHAPSNVPLDMPGGVFGKPTAMTHDDILRTIERFADCALVAKKTGFDGVQIHAAHGYLISQFLSPRANKCTDIWGGNFDNRARLLSEIIRACRHKVGKRFPISVKLNSSDFQYDGYDFKDCLRVIDILNALKVDLIEVSGGNYEQPKMMDLEGISKAKDELLQSKNMGKREAYFLDFAKVIKMHTKIPIMVTGGFRTREAMEDALEKGAADMIGVARPLCTNAFAIDELFDGKNSRLSQPELKKRLGPWPLNPKSPFGVVKAVTGFGRMSWLYLQIQDLADDKEKHKKRGLLSSFSTMQKIQKKQARKLVRRKKITYDA